MIRSFIGRHVDALCGFLLFVGSLIVYLHTLCPTVYWGDGGELAAAAYTLGIAHPTGYPVWCLLAKLWTLVFPFGSIAWRLNVLSAIFGAGAVAALYGFGREIGLRRVLSTTAAGLFAFSFTFWQQCLQVETYSLTACYTCTLLFLAARYRRRGCVDGDLTKLAFAYGLAMTNHQTNTLFLPGFLLFVVLSRPSLIRLRDRSTRIAWRKAIAAWAAPLAFYLYLPIRAAANPGVDWGHPSTLSTFLFHVSGGYYRGIMFTGSAHDVWLRLSTYAKDLGVEFPWAMVFVAVLGVFLMWKRDRPLAALLSWMVLADVVYTINYAIYNGYIYLIPTNIVLCVLMAYGLQRTWEGLPLLPQARPRLAVAGSTACLVLVAMQLMAHAHVSLRGRWECYDYARNILLTAPPNAVIVDSNDVAGYPVFTYLQQVEGMRHDVVVVDRGLLAELGGGSTVRNAWVFDDVCRRFPELRARFPHGLTAEQARDEEPLKEIMSAAVYGAEAERRRHAHPELWAWHPEVENQPVLIDDLMQNSGIAVDGAHAVGYGDFLRSHYDVVRIGLVDRLYPRGGRPSDAQLFAETERCWSRYRTPGVYDGMLQRDAFLTTLAVDYSQAGLARAELAYRLGRVDVAAASYRNVLSLFPLQEAVDGLRRCGNGQRVSSAN